MTQKRKNKIFLGFIFLLAFLSFNFVFPQYINKGISFIKEKTEGTPFINKIPLFPDKDFKLGLDLQGGSRLIYQADLSVLKTEDNEEKASMEDEAMAGLRDVIERRVNLFGVAEPNVAIQQSGQGQRLLVELAGAHDIEEAIEMIGKTPYLEFREEIAEEEMAKILEKRKELEGKTWEEIQQVENWQLAQEDIFQPTKLTGKYLKKAFVSLDQTTFAPEVLLEFNSQGKDLFKEITARNIGKPIAIFIDDVLISAPVVQEEISGGAARITGDFTLEQTKELVRNLNAGALPLPIKLISQTTIGPTLGKVSLEKSLLAGAFGLILIILFMIVFYKMNGFLASFSLLIYGLILLSMFKIIPITLTLAGIGGAILSIGMAVDANVLIFERQKEEKAKGESFGRALETGFSRAWPSIRDGNLTTLLVGLIMFSFGAGFVKGFALTLSLGILVSMFSALFVTRTLMRSFVGTRWEKLQWLWGR